MNRRWFGVNPACQVDAWGALVDVTEFKAEVADTDYQKSWEIKIAQGSAPCNYKAKESEVATFFADVKIHNDWCRLARMCERCLEGAVTSFESKSRVVDLKEL